MLNTTGIAETCALQILGELAVRPGPAYASFQVGQIGREAADYLLAAKLGCKRSWPSCEKLLHAPFVMFGSNQPYDGSKLCALELAGKAVAACAGLSN
jgi:hypothetical protein